MLVPHVMVDGTVVVGEGFCVGTCVMVDGTVAVGDGFCLCISVIVDGAARVGKCIPVLVAPFPDPDWRWCSSTDCQ